METTADGTALEVVAGPRPVTVVVDGAAVEVGSRPVRVPLRAPAPLRAEPTQPAGREPRT